MGDLRMVTPAPLSAVLEVLPGHAHYRKAVLFQARTFQSTAILDGDRCLAVVMFRPWSCKRLEFALAIRRDAAPKMRGLIRMAQLTLAEIAQDHVVFARVQPTNEAGRRMAQLTGFVKSRAGPEIWIWR